MGSAGCRPRRSAPSFHRLMPAIPALLLALQAIVVQPESGEVHLRHVRQLTFGGQNAEAYFAASGRLLIFQRHGPGATCGASPRRSATTAARSSRPTAS